VSSVLIVVPTHNEVDNITELLDRLSEHVPDADIVVVDDISTDGTRTAVRETAAARPNVRLVERSARLGLGSAYVHGFGIALACGYDLVAEIDADLSHDPSALPRLLSVGDLGIPVVIGSRYVPGGSIDGWSRRRIWLSRWGNRYAALMLGLAVNDATAGLRVYRTDALETIGLDDIRSDGHGFQIEMTSRAADAGLAVVEIPIEFRNRAAGVSKLDRRSVIEAFKLVTVRAVIDTVSLRRRKRAYRVAADPSTESHSASS